VRLLRLRFHDGLTSFPRLPGGRESQHCPDPYDRFVKWRTFAEHCSINGWCLPAPFPHFLTRWVLSDRVASTTATCGRRDLLRCCPNVYFAPYEDVSEAITTPPCAERRLFKADRWGNSKSDRETPFKEELLTWCKTRKYSKPRRAVAFC